MKKLLMFLLAALLILLPPLTVFAAEEETEGEETITTNTEKIISELDLEGLEELYGNAGELFQGNSLEDTLTELSKKGLASLSMEDALNAVFAMIKDSFAGNWRILVQVILVMIVMGILNNMRSSFGEEGVSETATWTGYVIICILLSSILVDCIATASDTIGKLSDGIETLTPVLMVLLTGMGDVTSSAVLSPVLTGLSGSIFMVAESVVIPLIIVYAVFTVISGVVTTIKLDSVCKLLESVVKWLLGIMFVVFIGIGALKGVSGAMIDGVYFKTAKFTVDKMVPIIGGMFSDTLETVMACSLIVKNAVGIVGLLAIAAVIARPLFALLANMFLMKLCAAAGDIFMDSSMTAILTGISKSILLLFVAVLTLSAMVFIFIAVIMGTADASVMIR